MTEKNNDRPNLKLMGDSRVVPAEGPRQNTVLGRIRRFLDLIAFASLLLIVVLTAIPYGSTDAWWTSAFECAVFAVAALWFLRILLGENLRLNGLSLLFPL